MLVLYVTLDGYDLGAGAIHLGLARTDAERRTVIEAIGPYWDANEVWLIAAGGSLLVAFPRVMSAALSGFYFAIFFVVWCLILRAIAIELRSHLRDPLWRKFWDVVFAGSSALLALLLGVAFGNVVRGVPLNADGWFGMTLFTTFRPARSRRHPGLLHAARGRRVGRRAVGARRRVSGVADGRARCRSVRGSPRSWASGRSSRCGRSRRGPRTS
jgi:cytochrome d ubiquinol oxidase subunit II